MSEVHAARVLTLLRLGQLTAAVELAEAHHLPISRARCHLAAGDTAAALAVLSSWRHEVEARGWPDEQLKVMVLEAVALQAHGDSQLAVRLLFEALALTEAGGLVRLFVMKVCPWPERLVLALDTVKATIAGSSANSRSSAAPKPSPVPARWGCARTSTNTLHGATIGRMVKRRAIDRVRQACLALPEAQERPFGGHTAPSFRVRDKFFAMTSEDGLSLTLKVPQGVNAILVGDSPELFFMPAYVASKGWVGVRLDAVRDWAEIEDLIRGSYRLIAPKRLAAQLDGAA
jgi:predicted DNA-binding protein (MmcQ/YjbR family)